jgi:hypothetical protein
MVDTGVDQEAYPDSASRTMRVSRNRLRVSGVV